MSADSAEVAFSVDEDDRRLGIASCLLHHLEKNTEDKGLKQFTAQVLPSEVAMLGLFLNCGCAMKLHTA
jgi:ribosomal protein S18 acetylase RimI-like enzyme